MRVGRRTRNEIVKWNQMTALRFQTSDDIPGLSSGMHLQCQVFIGWKHVGPRRSIRLRTVYFALNYPVHIVQGYKCVCVHQHTHTYVHTHTLHTHTHTDTHTRQKNTLTVLDRWMFVRDIWKSVWWMRFWWICYGRYSNNHIHTAYTHMHTLTCNWHTTQWTKE